MSYIRSADAALYYEEYGTGETLILLPDLLHTVESDWRRFIPEFARHFHTIAVDLRAHGKTNNPSNRLHFDTLLGDLHTLCESLEIETAFLCTHGRLASLLITYAMRHQESVHGIILHAPDQCASDAVAAGTPPELSATTRETLQHLHEPANGPEGWSVLVKERDALLHEIAKQAPDRNALSLLRVPVLVTAGDQTDSEALYDFRMMASLFGDGSFSMIAQSGRGLGTVQRQPFVEAVVTFTRRVASIH